MRKMKTPICFIVALLPLFFIHSVAGESLDGLDKRIKLEKYYDAIKSGDRNVYQALPAKGYKNGFTGILKKFKVYPNPEYSFVDCGENMKKTKSGSIIPGCVVSLKLARRSANGSYTDIGLRIEYAIGLGESKFEPNNSVYAQHAVSGDGVLEKIIQSY